MTKILVHKSASHAGSWIYNGFAAGWESLGYEVERWEALNHVTLENKILMITSGDIHLNSGDPSGVSNYLRQADKIYMFVSPTKFPHPWGTHLNFVDQTARDPKSVSELKKLPNIVFWTFCDVSKQPDLWEDWGEVHYIPLAFDSINYERIYDPQYAYDVCYVGGYANNGFNTKYEIMKEYFSAFKDSGLKCGFFVNKNLTHEQECKLLTNSTVCLNIHDEYQHALGLDTNERTWKSLGLNGILVSDYVGDVVPDYVYQCRSGKEMVEKVQELIANYDLPLKERNSSMVQKKHTYIERCKQLEKL